MKYAVLQAVLIAVIISASGCAHHNDRAAMDPRELNSSAESTDRVPSSEVSGKSSENQPVMFASSSTIERNLGETYKISQAVEMKSGFNDDDWEEEEWEQEEFTIADPLEPFNRAMFQFNDTLYFRVLKPVAQGYSKVVPKPARSGISHFFDNLKFPIRFVNNLLQANFKGACSELGRFTVNTLWGVGGFLDPASKKELAIPEYDADFGQTLGMYGFGPGFYIVWPGFGPSSARDTLEIGTNIFLNPVSYVDPGYISIAARAYEIVNDTSLRIGDYEILKEAAIDPYVSLRHAYIQYREEMIRQRKNPPKPGGIN
ncbi:MAG: VacJ family lipoprotein [Syntrophales bacterium]|jgi:phospholipid-binding lipoprotein MlaA|nr:VacJ family lipoprotein [Syntrophales bacterium]MDY0043709.1 VacJ family lipoprotein [Syntrophales bacterium]